MIPSIILFFFATLVSTADAWGAIDTATLQFWSPQADCTEANFDDDKTCARSESIVDINVTLDNTGATCYSNPYQSPSTAWFHWVGSNPLAGGSDMYAYSLYVPGGQPKPDCDNRGVCDPCDALNPIRGNNPAEWSDPNITLIKELGYSYSSAYTQFTSGCGTRFFAHANEVLPTNFCGPFQGNITVEYGDPYTCVNKGIVSAETCGAACDKEKGLERAVYMNDENGEPACCMCKYYNRGGFSSPCDSGKEYMCFGDMDSSNGNHLCLRTFFITVATAIVLVLL